MIVVEGLSKIYPGKGIALSELSFHAKPGEVVGLIGENGAGKTTAFRIMATLINATSGDCFIDGYDIHKDPLSSRSRIGTLFGSGTGLYERLTARENIIYFARLHGVNNHDAEKRLALFVKRLDMKEFIDRRVGTFSQGMRQKTAIARSCMHHPPVLILDEPTTGLDIGSTITLHDILLRFKNEGKTILLSSHNIAEIQKLCDRVIILHKGSVMAQGTPRGIARKYGGDFGSLFLNFQRGAS
jgi:sodium transport system ATP-binding protein